VLMLYLVKIMIHLPVFTCFKKWPFYCVQQVSRCHPNFIILVDTCQKSFVMKLLRQSAHQTWLYMLQLYLVMQARI